MEGPSVRDAENLGRSEYLLVTDVGSTTTKALLLRRTHGGLTVAGSASSPTTVEKPTEDVCVGLRKALELLEASSGISVTDGNGNPSVPYITTSSAGGGLQMLVFGLTSVETGRVAQVAAYGAGGVILGTMTIDDEVPAVDKMRLLHDLHPDMVLMAGGFEGGAIANVVNLAELLTLADPQPKFRQNMKIPLVFCGNTGAREFVTGVLEETFDVHIADNIRPSGMEMNLGPAREAVHRLFMDNVMERAPGYAELKGMVSADIIPTPSGVERILVLYGKHLEGNTLMMDMGGATTDIFSNVLGTFHRTVAANTGLSYSISNILAECGIESVMSHLPDGFDEAEVRDYIANKTLYPTYVPASKGEVAVEHALAIEGTSLAWRHHLDLNFRAARLGFLDRLKANAGHVCKFEQQFTVSDETPFYISDIDTIIGSGGVLAHADGMQAMRILTDGFRPHGITRLMTDRYFRSPHMGVLSGFSPEEALELWRNDCLEEIGWVVAPLGDVRKGRHVLEVREARTGQTVDVRGGDLRLYPDGGDFTFVPAEGVALDREEGERSLETVLPVLIDARGRGEKSIDVTLTESGIAGFAPAAASLDPGIAPAVPAIETGEFMIERRLPYEGTILVDRCADVEPGDVLGENRYSPPRLYILDLNRVTGYDRHLTPEELSAGLRVWTGDAVSLGQQIFRVHRPGVTGFDFYYHSPVRGRVIRIEKSGLVVLREIQDYDGKPHVVKVAEALGVRPSRIRGCIRHRVGDFVSAGQSIASDVARGIFVKAPSSGVIKEIDTSRGTVTVQYDLKPVLMRSTVRGRVEKVIEGRGVVLGVKGSRLEGVIGFGTDGFGTLVTLSGRVGNPPRGSVLACRTPIDAAFLREAEGAGAAGIIAPSIPNGEWVEYYGKEMGVALTGDESIPFTLVLTAGFGSFGMDGRTWEFLEGHAGHVASLSGRTQVRAGVTRPHVLVCG
jgi:uncharacterized protein (TIGR01319 family)